MVGFEIGRAALGRGWVARVAVASTRVAALILAQARPGLTVVPPGDEARTLAPLPIEVLEACRSFEFRVSGFEFRAPSPQSRRLRSPSFGEPAGALAKAGVPSPEMFITLRRWGLRTLGELAALPPADLSARLGPEGPALQRLARGQDPRPLVPVVDPERFEASFDLEWPIEGIEPLSFVLARVLEPLCARLERADRGAAALTVGLTLTTHETHTRTLQLPAPLRDARALRTLALLDLESHPPPAGIDRVAVAIEPAPGLVTQFSLIEHPRPSPERLSTLVARLGALMGEGRVGAPALVDTHRPGAFGVETFDPESVTTTERTRNEHGNSTTCQSAISNQQSAMSWCGAPLPRAARGACGGRWRAARARDHGASRSGRRPDRRVGRAVARVRRLVGQRRAVGSRRVGRAGCRRRRVPAVSRSREGQVVHRRNR